MEFKYIIMTILVFVLLWINILASLAIKNDDTLDKIQTIGQFVIVWLVPYFGAVIVLKTIFSYAPEALPKLWIPWPFKTFIFRRPIKNRGGSGGIIGDPTSPSLNGKNDFSSGGGGD